MSARREPSVATPSDLTSLTEGATAAAMSLLALADRSPTARRRQHRHHGTEDCLHSGRRRLHRLAHAREDCARERLDCDRRGHGGTHQDSAAARRGEEVGLALRVSPGAAPRAPTSRAARTSWPVPRATGAEQRSRQPPPPGVTIAEPFPPLPEADEHHGQGVHSGPPRPRQEVGHCAHAPLPCRPRAQPHLRAAGCCLRAAARLRCLSPGNVRSAWGNLGDDHPPPRWLCAAADADLRPHATRAQDPLLHLRGVRPHPGVIRPGRESRDQLAARRGDDPDDHGRCLRPALVLRMRQAARRAADLRPRHPKQPQVHHCSAVQLDRPAHGLHPGRRRQGRRPAPRAGFLHDRPHEGRAARPRQWWRGLPGEPLAQAPTQKTRATRIGVHPTGTLNPPVAPPQTFCYVDDACDAVLRMVEHPDKSVGHTFNVGNPDNNIRISDLAELMSDMYSRITGKPKATTKKVSGEEYYGKGYEDSDLRIPSMKLINKQLDWSPKTSLKDAMEMTVPAHPPAPTPPSAWSRPAGWRHHLNSPSLPLYFCQMKVFIEKYADKLANKKRAADEAAPAKASKK
eukprot:scaffold351_cov117-Isochrysis_galbana.AAC.9